jgi:LysM repeat protein
MPTPAATPSPVAASPSAVASATPGPSASPRTYKVRSGDSVASIALKFHTTVKAIVAANKIIDARTIHPGQVLIIP